MAGYRGSSAAAVPAPPPDTLPKLGHVTEVREAWLVRTDGALAHHLQDREISSHLCENRYRNRQIREDFPVALGEQQCIEYEARQREFERLRQAERDAEMAREIAEINLRRRRRDEPRRDEPSCSRRLPPEPAQPPPPPLVDIDLDVEALGLSHSEVAEMKMRLEQEERDARLARELSNESDSPDALLADMRVAVEAQDNELARLLQEREYRKLQKAKEKARQRALQKKQQKLAEQEQQQQNQSFLLDAYSDPRDMLHERPGPRDILHERPGPRDILRDRPGPRASKSVDSDLNYVEPFQKEHIESRASALQSHETSQQMFADRMPNVPLPARVHDRRPSDLANNNSRDYNPANRHSVDLTDDGRRWRQPPLLPTCTKKPRFPDPVSIRPASRYPSDHNLADSPGASPGDTYNNNNTPPPLPASADISRRLSVASDNALDAGPKKKKNSEAKKKKGCKIQ